VGPRRRERSTTRTALLVAAVLLLVVVLGIGVTALFDGDGGTTADAAPSTAGQAAAPAAGPEPGDRETVDGRTFVAERVQTDPTCVGNAYGAVAAFFTGTDCSGLARALYSTDVGGRPVVVSVSVADMGDASGGPGAARAGRPERQRQRERPAARGRALPRWPGAALECAVRQRRSPATP
jgi:hypothetical protein